MTESRTARKGPAMAFSKCPRKETSRNAQPAVKMSDGFAKLSCKGIPMTC